MRTYLFLLLCSIDATLLIASSGLPLIENFSGFDTNQETPEQIIGVRGDLAYGNHTPITITRPGVYRLTNAMQAAQGSPAIIIDSDKVSIDFDGYTISGDILITNNHALILLTNGTLNGSIQASTISHLSIISMNIQATQTGIAISGTATALLIQNSIIWQYATAGISVNTIESGSITQCDFIGNNAGTGIEVQSGNGITITSCTCKNNDYGTYLGSATTLKNIRIANCIISASSLAGATFFGCTGVELCNSKITRDSDATFNSAGIDIQTSSHVVVQSCFVSGFSRGIRIQSNTTGFAIQDCAIEGNIRGICAASGVKGSIKGCTLQNNGRGVSSGCGFLDSTGPTTKVWYVGNIAMANGDRPAATSSRYDTNYCTGVDTPATTLSGIQPVNGSDQDGNTRAPFFQLIKDQGGGGGGASGVLGGLVKGCIGYWDNVTAALT